MYYQRIIEKKIKRKLGLFGAICINGPKYCGKSTTCSFFSKSSIRINNDPNLISSFEMSPELLLNGEKPRLIDE
jgi:predicted AAA+ superfamily ATPase